MPYTVRLQKGGAFTSDLGKVCNGARANGANIQRDTCTLQLGTSSIQLLINLAYQPNSQVPPASHSLYVLGFINAHGTFVFNMAPFPGGAIAAANNLGVDGSYGSLGYANGFGTLTLNANNLTATIQALQNHTAAALVDATLKTHLARAIIASTEAFRIKTVGDGIDAMLAGTTNDYTPDWGATHNWGGHSLGY